MDPIELPSELREPLTSLNEAREVTLAVLGLLDRGFVKERSADSTKYSEYVFFAMEKVEATPFAITQTKEISRPVNAEFFIRDRQEFSESFDQLLTSLSYTDFSDVVPDETRNLIQKVLYTIGMSFGIGMDFTIEDQGAKKNIGERFSQVLSGIFGHLGVASSTEIQPFNLSRLDIIISPHDVVQSSESNFDDDETVVSVKTTTKDRLKNIYNDKSTLEENIGREASWIAVFLGDVQRSSRDSTDFGVSKTFVSSQFEKMQGDAPLHGLYYIDLPSGHNETAYSDIIRQFDRLICDDLWDYV